MKKVLLLLAFVCTACLTTFTLTSCEAEESGDLLVYVDSDCNNDNINFIIWSITNEMKKECDMVDSKNFIFKGSFSDSRKRAKKAFEKACQTWENSEEYKDSRLVYAGWNAILMEINQGNNEVARHTLGPQKHGESR